VKKKRSNWALPLRLVVMVGKKKALREGVSKSPEGIAIGKVHLHGVQFRRSHVTFGSG
jgi:hypothetical protein